MGDSAGGILALTTGRTLLNQLPSMVYGRGLLLGSGVRAMSDLQVAYIVRLNGKGKGSIEYLTPEEIEREGASK